MKTITNTYYEPIVLQLLARTTGKAVKDRWTMQLLVGQSTTLKDEYLSPEIWLLAKKGKISVENVEQAATEQVQESPVKAEENSATTEIESMDEVALEAVDPKELLE